MTHPATHPATGARAARAPAADLPAWEATDVVFRHAGARHPALDGVSVTVPAGGVTALIGPNGAGKSTLLHVLLGALAPSAGTVRHRGRLLASWPRRALAREVGVVTQSEEGAFPTTVRDLVAMGRYAHTGPWRSETAADRDAVDEAMRRCDVHHLADRLVPTLSGGERQRARVARALAQIAPLGSSTGAGVDGTVAPTARALALDEPTAALDVRHEMAIFELVRDLGRAGVGVLLVTHHLNLAARYADRLLLLEAGRVAAAGPPAAVLTRATVERVYGWPVEIVPHPGPGADAGAPQVVPLAGAECARMRAADRAPGAATR